MEKKAEYKIKKLKDVGTPWEDLPVVITATVDPETSDPEDLAKRIMAPNTYEIRWNFEGSYQGHYVPGPARSSK